MSARRRKSRHAPLARVVPWRRQPPTRLDLDSHRSVAHSERPDLRQRRVDVIGRVSRHRHRSRATRSTCCAERRTAASGRARTPERPGRRAPIRCRRWRSAPSRSTPRSEARLRRKRRRELLRQPRRRRVPIDRRRHDMDGAGHRAVRRRRFLRSGRRSGEQQGPLCGDHQRLLRLDQRRRQLEPEARRQVLGHQRPSGGGDGGAARRLRRRASSCRPTPGALSPPSRCRRRRRPRGNAWPSIASRRPRLSPMPSARPAATAHLWRRNRHDAGPRSRRCRR